VSDAQLFPQTDTEIMDEICRHLTFELEKADKAVASAVEKREEAQERLEKAEALWNRTKAREKGVDMKTGEVK